MDEARPRARDIVIHRQVHSPAVYVVGRFDGPLDVLYGTYVEAVDRASGFAGREHLDVWYTTDELTFHLVAQHRAVE